MTDVTIHNSKVARWLPALLWLLCLPSSTMIDAAGVQSGPSNGNSYAGGMFYDENNGMLYLTGQTYDASTFDSTIDGGNENTGSDCFVAAIDLMNWDWDETGVLSSTSSSSSVTTTCQAVGYVAPSTLVVGGNSEPGGFAYSGSEDMSGFLSLVERSDISEPLDRVALLPTAEGRRVEYPQFLVTSTSGRFIYSISLSSLGEQDNTPDDILYPNYMTLLKYGNSFDMSVRKLSLQQEEFLGVPTGPIMLQQEWLQEFPIQDNDSSNPAPRVYVGGVIIKNNRALVVAGSTRGLGTGYGSAIGDDEDGFVTVLDLETGELYPSDGMPRNNVRIGTEANDVVTGICDDPQDTKAFFIVGATAGDIDTTNDSAMPPPDGSLKAFVSRLEIGTLQTSWSRQFGARMTSDDISTVTGAFAAGCSVVGDTVFVAGGVENGAGMIIDQEVLQSQGSDDLWVASLNTADGSDNWMKQVGTDQDDLLSRHGGVAVDADGNVILYGNTQGSLYRTRDDTEDSTDVFVMILSAEEGDYTPVGQPVAPPTQAPVAPTQAPVPLPTIPPAEFVPIGHQLTGPLFAGGMVYDARENRVWLTGASYPGDVGGSSQCFVANVKLSTGQVGDMLDFGAEKTNEACNAVGYSQLEDLVYVVGGTQRDGFLVTNSNVNPSDANDNPDTVQFGLMMQFQADGTKLTGGGVNHQDVVQYPVAVELDPSDDLLYVASMGSDSEQKYNIPSGETPNFTAGGIRSYGDAFYTVIQRYRITSTADSPRVKKNLDEEFYQRYEIGQEDESIFTSGMTLAANGQTLVVVGSTRGTGGPFGAENTNDDMDGFILKLDSANGNLQSTNGHRSSTRLDSIDKKDDWVTNVCNDRFDHDAIYVVGATQGKVRALSDNQQPPAGTTHAFVAKVSLETLEAEWLKHFTMQPGSSSGPAQSSALGCAVTNEGNGMNLVYIAGTVESGATLDGAEVTPGADGDDVFVVQMGGNDGEVKWIQQVGTSDTDRLAHGGGIALDSNGNAILYAETSGSFYASATAEQDGMDVVVFTLDKEDGSYKTLVENGGDAPPPTPAPQAASPDNDEDKDEPDIPPDSITALQTGPDVGPTYAGGMYYDRFTNSIYVTGATYGSFDGSGVQANSVSSCLFGSVSLPALSWREKMNYGSTNAPEACNALSITNFNNKAAAVVIGSTEDGGLLSQLGTNGIPAKQYGIAMDLASVDGKFVLQGGAAMDQNGVQFPVAVETNDDGVAWIVSMTSEDTKVNPSYDKVSTDEYPNLTTGGIIKYGSKYRIVMERYSILRSGAAEDDAILESSLQRDWRKPFETASQESIFVSDLITVKGGKSLVVVGSTKGTQNAADMDGIMAKIDPDKGKFMSGEKGSRAMAYFASVTSRDDWILGACPDPDDGMSFYVVGATQGNIDSNANRDKQDVTVHAVVAKMHADSLEATWTKQFSVTHASGTDSKGAAASAFGCAVIPGTNSMYIAGTVENGATIDQGDQRSAGRDDIFVAKLWTKGGAVAWMKQVGSDGDDRIAHGGGVKVDANGNAVVFGDTNGSFFRERSSDGATKHHSDLFMMIFDQDDGIHTQPWIADPIDALPADTSTPNEWYPDGVDQDRTTLKLISFALIALGILIVGACFLCFRRRQLRKRAEAQKSSIFAYLQQFDVEDIDLRKSPPGGWHGTYLNKLAYGINKAETSNSPLPDVDSYPRETAPLTHSSIVSDSLFMDTSSAPSLGYRDVPELHGLDYGYDDLKPRTYEERSKNLKEVI